VTADLIALLPDGFRDDACRWDDRAKLQAYLDAVHDLARTALRAARNLDAWHPASRGAADLANELHAAAAHVCPGIEEA
jgi:hypothetical protein